MFSNSPLISPPCFKQKWQDEETFFLLTDLNRTKKGDNWIQQDVNWYKVKSRTCSNELMSLNPPITLTRLNYLLSSIRLSAVEWPEMHWNAGWKGEKQGSHIPQLWNRWRKKGIGANRFLTGSERWIRYKARRWGGGGFWRAQRNHGLLKCLSKVGLRTK